MPKLPLLLIFLTLLTTTYSITCHYSCYSCSSKDYSACNSCLNGYLIHKVQTQGSIQGTCVPVYNSNVTILGVIFLVLVFTACCLIFNEEIIYLALFAQSLGLLYLVEVYWTPVLDYIYASLTFLMVFTKITYTSKADANPTAYPQIVRGRFFMGQLELPLNLAGVGIASLVLIIVMLIIIGLKAIRKKLTKDRAHFLPDWVLDKIYTVLALAFIFMIQQSMTVIFFSLKYGTITAAAIILAILYFIGLILFTINQFIHPLPVFRNKAAQLNIIIGRAISPLFMTFPTTAYYMAFLFLLLTWVIDLIITHKNRNNKQINQLLVYKIIGLVVLVLMIVYYATELLANSQNITYILGIVGAVAVVFDLHLIIVQCGINLKRYLWKEENSPKKGKRSVNQKQNKSSQQPRHENTLESLRNEQNYNVFDQKQKKQQIAVDSINYDFRQDPPNLLYEQNSNTMSPIKQLSNVFETQSDPPPNQNQPDVVANISQQVTKPISIRPHHFKPQQPEIVRDSPQLPQISPEQHSSNIISQASKNDYNEQNRHSSMAVEDCGSENNPVEPTKVDQERRKYKKRRMRATQK